MTPKFNVGDVVEFRRTLTVTAPSDGVIVYGRDVKSGLSLGFVEPAPVTIGGDSARFVLVRKAAKPKPKVGDVIDGATLKATHWKRGTVVLSDSIPCLLLADGTWSEPNAPEGWTFEAAHDNDEFEVVYLP